MLTNKKHIQFVDALFVLSMNATAAYKQVYKITDDNVAKAAASRLLANVNVSLEVSKRQILTSKKFNITKEELMQDLLDIKNQTKSSFPPSSLKAIEILGFNEPDKVEIKQDVEFILPGITTNSPTQYLEDSDDDDSDEDQG